MGKHTKGPWHVGGEAHGDFYIWGPDPKAYGYIAQANACGSKTNPRAERMANARLIAAAPELLEACTALAALYDDKAKAKIAEYEGSGTEALADPDFVDAVFAKQVYETVTPAITKATGGTDATLRTD